MLSRRYLPWVLIVAAGLVLFAMLRLGLWQLDRAEEKQNISDSVFAMSQIEIELNSTTISAKNRYVQAIAYGRYLQQNTFLLDGKVVNGQVGYHVITPFEIKMKKQVILVNRGWVAVGSNRKNKPKIITPAGELQISGRLNLPASKPVFWDEAVPVVQDGAWQFLELNDYTARSGIAVLPLMIELDKTLDQVGGYVRQWRSYDDHWVNRHRAYAFQWFSMALAFLVLCIFVWYKSKKRKILDQ